MEIASRTNPEEVWRIEMLGGLRVRRGDRFISDSLPRKTASLLACLAFYRGRSHAREELMEMLWPDEDPDATRLRFRQVLTTLRRELDPAGDSVGTLLVADRKDVRINPAAMTTDVLEFESKLADASRAPTAPDRAERLLYAVRRYAGDLLPGFYDDWVSRERQRLADEYLDALNRLSEELLASGRMREAVDYARRAAATDPMHEPSARTLMTVLAASGRQSEAIRHYHALEQSLWKELRAAPSEATRELMETIRGGSIVPSPAHEHEPRGALPDSAEPMEEISPATDLSASKPRLPEILTPFFGRHDEMDYLIKALNPAAQDQNVIRLITLVGPGGAGKTRLGAEVAKRLAAAYNGAVWFVSLSGVSSEAQLVATLSEELYPHKSGGMGTAKDLADVIGNEPAMVILDNSEQLDEDSARCVRSLIGQAPGLRCLVTSRRPLNVEGEQQFRLLPLPVPGSADHCDALSTNPSVQLFIDRARKTRSDFVLDQFNAADIAAVCRRLEGIPLALELAAGWASALTPAQILDRLTRRFELLVSRRKDIDERHQSLWSTITWSYEQLPSSLQRLFARLSAFRNGWTLEAAETVCIDPAADPEDAGVQPSILDGLEELRQRSLIEAEPSQDGMRFRMLDCLREFAEQQVPEDERQALPRAHAQYFHALSVKAYAALAGPEQIPWLERLEADHHNLCAAVEWSVSEGGDIELGLEIVGSVWRFWDARFHRADAERLWELLSRKLDSASPAARAFGLEGIGALAVNYDDDSLGQERLTESLAINRGLGNESAVGRTLCWLGASLRDTGRIAEARAVLEESLAIAERQANLGDRSTVLAALAACAREDGDLPAARSLLDQAAAFRRITGNSRGLAYCALSEGLIAVLQGDFTGAVSLLDESIALYRMVRDPVWIVQPLFLRAYIARNSAEPELARSLAEEALVYAQRTLLASVEAIILVWLGDLALECNALDDAGKRYQDAVRLSLERGFDFELRCGLGGLAAVEARRGRTERAVCLCASAERIEAQAQFEIIRRHALDIPALMTDLQRTSDPEQFQAARKRGGEMNRAQAVACALGDA